MRLVIKDSKRFCAANVTHICPTEHSVNTGCIMQRRAAVSSWQGDAKGSQSDRQNPPHTTWPGHPATDD